MAQASTHGAREGQNVYIGTHVSGPARVHLGNVYMSNTENDDDIETNKEKAKAGE
jgi:hypothetical protein